MFGTQPDLTEYMMWPETQVCWALNVTFVLFQDVIRLGDWLNHSHLRLTLVVHVGLGCRAADRV